MLKITSRLLLLSVFICLLACEGEEDFFLEPDPKVDVEDIFAPRANNCRVKRIFADAFSIEFEYDFNGRIVKRLSSGFLLAEYYYNDQDRIDSVAYPTSNGQDYKLIVWENSLPVRISSYISNMLVYFQDNEFNDGKLSEVNFTNFLIIPTGDVTTTNYSYEFDNLIRIEGKFGATFLANAHDNKRNYSRLMGWTFLDNISFLDQKHFSKNNLLKATQGELEFVYTYEYNSKFLPAKMTETFQDNSYTYQFEYENCD